MDGWGRSWRRALHEVAVAAALVIAFVPIPASARQADASLAPQADTPPAPPAPLAAAPIVLPPPLEAAVSVVNTRAPEVSVRWADLDARLSFVPPPGWVPAAATSLNPQSDPPEPVLERVRFQSRAGDPALYAAPVPVTSALVRDAGAIISVALARYGTDLAALRADGRSDASDTTPLAGFVAADEETEYEGIRVLTRYLIARSGARVIVVHAYVAEEQWKTLEPMLRDSIASMQADPAGPNAPEAAPVAINAPVSAEPPPAASGPPAAGAPAPAVDSTLAARQEILARAQQLLGTPYVWGGNSGGRAMDCSSYVSAAWDVDRYSTDSIGRVSSPIEKEELRPGDALNLTIGRDPQRFGHIRLFQAWANDAHTLLWVYEETPPRAVHRVIAYDDRYEPIRLDGLSSVGATAVVPAPLSAPERLFRQGPQTPGVDGPVARPARSRATPTPRYAIPYELRGGRLVPVAIPTATPRHTARPVARPARPTLRTAARPTLRPTVRVTPLPSGPRPEVDGLLGASPAPSASAPPPARIER